MTRETFFSNTSLILLSPRTKLVAITHVSNALGTITPIAEIVRLAHNAGALVLVDGCQAVPHTRVDVQALGADFYVFSGHKIWPTGIGVLLRQGGDPERAAAYQGGGEMILSVTFDKTTYKKAPHRFEAGTPAIVETIGLGAAVDYLEKVGLDWIEAHEHELLAYATDRLSALPRLRFVGTAERKAAIASFLIDGVHPHDIGTILDQSGVAIRAGHHCAQPLMHRLGVPATAAPPSVSTTPSMTSMRSPTGCRWSWSFWLMLDDLRELYQGDPRSRPVAAELPASGAADVPRRG